MSRLSDPAVVEQILDIVLHLFVQGLRNRVVGRLHWRVIFQMDFQLQVWDAPKVTIIFGEDI